MKPSIFGLELSSLTFIEVKAFCDQEIPEGLRLDYKEEFPKRLQRVICAFTNTAGGIILIGVKTDKNTNKPTNIPGIEIKNGLEERVIDLCLSHISPPVIPEVKVCDFKSNPNNNVSDRAVLFIRVQGPSYAAPHYLLNENEILVRVHNKNAPADLRTIESLINRRESVKKASGDYVSASFSTKAITTGNEVYANVVFQPHFPTESFILYDKENNDWIFETINKVFRLSEQKPTPSYLALIKYNTSRQITFWCRLDRDGRIVLQMPINVNEHEISIYDSVIFLAKAINVVKQVYSHSGFYNDLSLGLTICNTKDTCILLHREIFGGLFQGYQEYKCDSPEITISEMFRYDELSQLDKIIQNFFAKLCLEFGLVLEKKVITETTRKILCTMTGQVTGEL